VTDREPGGHGPGVEVSSAEVKAVTGPPRHLRAVPDAPDLDSIYRDHADFVVRIARQLGAPPAHVEDVVHDVFLVVHRRLGDLRPDASVRSWLFGITKRVVLHRIRGNDRAARRERHAPEPRAILAPDEDLALREAAEAAEACLAELPSDQRIVLVLADLEDMSAPEIASALGVGLNTIYSRLRLARRKFERLLAELEQGGRR
jgi:RNA polymerase sigma-70 factor (ECF subfamily)